MKAISTNRQLVEEVPYGTYVWRCRDGEYLGDGEGRLLTVFAMKGDRVKIAALADVARHYGYPDGDAIFWTGQRPVTDNEYDEQVMREKLGLVADPFDYGAIKDEQRGFRDDH